MHQLPLVLFTVFIQAASGLLLFIGVNRLFLTGRQDEAAIKGLQAPQIFMWGLLIAGFVASTFHLGKPVNAYNMLGGLSNGSPLSMEIVCVGVLTALYTFLAWKGIKGQNVVLGAAMAAGLLLTWAVANVYTIVTIPLWNSPWTPFQFFMSVVSLGIVAMLFITSRASVPGLGGSRKKWNTAAIAVLLGLVAVSALYTAWSGYMLGQAGAQIPQAYLPIIRILLQLLGFLLLVMAGRGGDDKAVGLYVTVFICIFGSELVGRIFFYNLQQVSGMLQIFSY